MMWEYTFLTIKPYVYFLYEYIGFEVLEEGMLCNQWMTLQLCEYIGFEVLEEGIKVVLVLLFGRWHNKKKQKGGLKLVLAD